MNVTPVLALLASLAVALPALADDDEPLKGCAAKEQAVRDQLAEAKAHANSEQQEGLETGLKYIQANCNDAQLRKERETKVLEARQEVSKRQAKLEKAKGKGDPDKIQERKDELSQSNKELEKAVNELDR